MDPKARFEETRKNVLTLTDLKEPEQVPSTLYIETGWALNYAGVKWADLEDDPEAFARAYTKCWAEIPINIGDAPTRTTLRPPHALGNYQFVYTSDGYGIVHNQAADVYLGPEVYDEILADPQGLSTRFMYMHNPKLAGSREEAVEALKNAAKAQVVANETMGNINNILTNELGIFSISAFGTPYGYTSEFWTFYDRYRGTQKGLSDLRRYPDKIKAVCDVLYEQTKARVVYDENTMKEPLPPGFTMFHPEPFLSPKQFDELYFSRFMEIMNPVMEAGKKVFLYGEGAFLHHIERYRETPKGAMIINLDQDDPFEVKKRVGDWCTIIAGPKPELLQLGSEQQIKDFVKRCFDELAPGGGYIFSVSPGLISAKDAPVSGIVTAFETAYELSRG